MRFNLYAWSEISEGWHTCDERVQILLSRPGAVFVTQEGVETLLGFGSEFDAKIDGKFAVRYESADPSCRAYLYTPHARAIPASGDILTNLDRVPSHSPMMEAVLRAVRQMKLDQKQQMAELRAATAAARANHTGGPVPSPEPEPEPEPAPEPEPSE